MLFYGVLIGDNLPPVNGRDDDVPNSLKFINYNPVSLNPHQPSTGLWILLCNGKQGRSGLMRGTWFGKGSETRVQVQKATN